MKHQDIDDKNREFTKEEYANIMAEVEPYNTLDIESVLDVAFGNISNKNNGGDNNVN